MSFNYLNEKDKTIELNGKVISNKSIRKKKKAKKRDKKQLFFMRLLNRILSLNYLRLFKISINWLSGFEIKVEFFEEKYKQGEKK